MPSQHIFQNGLSVAVCHRCHCRNPSAIINSPCKYTHCTLEVFIQGVIFSNIQVVQWDISTIELLPPSGKFWSVVLAGNLNAYQCAKKFFWLHFWNPHPFICLFNKISLHLWRRPLGVIFIWKQKVKNDMCHFAPFSWLVAVKLAEVIFFALQIIGKGNNQGVAAN